MPGSLILIDSDTASSSTSISLTGMTSEYSVYMAIVYGVTHSQSAYDLLRFTVGGNPDVSTNYDSQGKIIRTQGAFFNQGGGGYTNAAYGWMSPYEKSTTAQDQTATRIHIFNSQNASGYTFATIEETSKGTQVFGLQGGMVLKENQITDGINFHPNLGNYPTGTFKLYGLKK